MFRIAPAVLLAFVLPAAHACDALQPFGLKVELTRGNMNLGKGWVTLSAGESPACYVFRQTAKPKFWLRWLSGEIEEQSEFCVENSQLRSQRYFYNRDGAGAKDENYSLEFDWQAGEVRGGAFESLPLAEGMSDQLLLQLRVRHWICTTLASGKPLPSDAIATPFFKRKGADDYEFAIIGEETVDVPAGRFETIRIDRVDPSNRSTSFWLAPAVDYHVVMAEQIKKDSPPIRLRVSEIRTE